MVGIVWAAAINLCEGRIVRPLLVGLPSASVDISVPEMVTQMARAMSAKTIASLAIFYSAMTAFFAYVWLTAGNAGERDLASFFTYFAAVFAIVMCIKLVAKRARAPAEGPSA